RVGERQRNAGFDHEAALPHVEYAQRLGEETARVLDDVPDARADHESDGRAPGPGRKALIDLAGEDLAQQEKGGDGEDRGEAVGCEDERPDGDCVHLTASPERPMSATYRLSHRR